jgi:hypothetical protein
MAIIVVGIFRICLYTCAILHVENLTFTHYGINYSTHHGFKRTQ